jgi:hypothetical protein
MLAGRFDVGVDAARADGSGSLSVQGFLEVVLVVPGAKIGRVAFALIMIVVGMNDRVLKVTGNKTLFPGAQKGVIDCNVAVQLVVYTEPLKGAENDTFPDFEVGLQVLGGRCTVAEPDDSYFVHKVELRTGQNIQERTRFLGEDDNVATQTVISSTLRA